MCVIKKYLKSGSANEEIAKSVGNAIGIMNKDPVSAIKAVNQLLHLPSTIRDGILWENFSVYLRHIFDYDENDEPRRKYKKSLSELLANQIPNEEAGYEGKPKDLCENAKRLIKLLDETGTIQKSVYYANLTRAALNDEITVGKFFKLCNCIRNIIEEDLEFLICDIQSQVEKTITDDREAIDDFRSVGLIKEVDGGFAYTLRAFELLKYGLMYEQYVIIPNTIQERIITGSIPSTDINKLF